METLQELQIKLSSLESELNSITRVVDKDTPFLPGQLDGTSEAYSYTEYTDPDRAAYLKYQIKSVQSQINNYANIRRQVAAMQEQREEAIRAFRIEGVSSGALEVYNAKMNEYMSKNFWGKAKALFTGKKPKKMSEQEAIATYAHEGAQKALAGRTELIEQKRQEELEMNQLGYADNPVLFGIVNDMTNKKYDKIIADMAKSYDSAAQKLSGGSR